MHGGNSEQRGEEEIKGDYVEEGLASAVEGRRRITGWKTPENENKVST